MNIKEKVGARLKSLREQKKLSQEHFAQLCGLDRTYISSVESGKRNISLVNIEKICTTLNISISEFFKVI